MIIGVAPLIAINFRSNEQPFYMWGSERAVEYLGRPTVNIELGPVSLTSEGELLLRNDVRELGLAILDAPNKTLHSHLQDLIRQHGPSAVAVALDEELSKR